MSKDRGFCATNIMTGAKNAQMDAIKVLNGSFDCLAIAKGQ